MTTLAFIQNVGVPQLLIILVVVLIIFGPKALPQLGRTLGKGLREFRNAADKASDMLSEDEEREAERERERERERNRLNAQKQQETTQSREKEAEPVEAAASDKK